MEDDRRARELKERSRAAFDAQAATYDEGMEGDHARGLYPLVAEEVASAVAGKEGPRLLDLGCGTGALAELVLARVPGSRLSCVDLSPRMADAARARLGSTRRRCRFPRSPLTPPGATTPSTTTPTPTGRRSRYGARSGREGRSSSGTFGSPRPPAPS